MIPKIYRPGEPSSIDLGALGASVVYDITGINAFTFQVDMPGKAWPTSAVVTARFSNDGSSLYDSGSAVTLSAAGITAKIDVGGWRYVGLVVTTAGSSSELFSVSGYGERI